MAKKKRELTTRRMPSGAQQYTRGDGTVGRMRTIDRAIRETENMPFRAESGLNRAFVDESRARPSERAFRDSLRTQSQALQEDLANRRGAKKFAEGGMVRGCKAGQMSGKKFSGSY